jgi:hypothetical protein
MTMKTLTLKMQWGSLGDHLLHSPIPRLAKEVHGYDRVLISNLSNFYSPQTKQFVWGRNPYIDGFNDEDHEHPTFTILPEGMNILDAVVDFYGLPDDGLRFREPEIYYTPKEIPELYDAVIFEPNHNSPHGIPTTVQTEEYFEANNIEITYDMKPLNGNRFASGRPMIEAETLEILSDVIHSCKAFYCYTSGVATLAAALGKPCTVLYVDGISSRFHHSKLHNYVRL